MDLAFSGSAFGLADSFAPVQVSGALFAIIGLYLVLMLIGVGIDLVVVTRALTQPLAWDRCVAWVKDRPWNWRVVGWVVLVLMCMQLVVVGVSQTLSILGWLRKDEPESFYALVQGPRQHHQVNANPEQHQQEIKADQSEQSAGNLRRRERIGESASAS